MQETFEPDNDLLVFDPTMKKKKKKDPEPELSNEMEIFGKKKKKVKKQESEAELEKEMTIVPENVSEPPLVILKKSGELDGEGVYDYYSLLGRINSLLGKTGQAHQKINIPPPQIAQVGSIKTTWINFEATVKSLNRGRDHFLQFVLAEMAVEGSLDGSGYLMIRGRFRTNQFEKIIRSYVDQYVTCKNCRSTYTELAKNRANRMLVLRCNDCKAEKSITNMNQTSYRAKTKQNKNRLKK
jgi:translation initiation factor 2 subunit 2